LGQHVTLKWHYPPTELFSIKIENITQAVLTVKTCKLTWWCHLLSCL